MKSSRPLTLLLALAATAATGCDAGSAQDNPPAERANKAEPSDAPALTKATCEHVVEVLREADPNLATADLDKVRTQCGETLAQLAQRHHTLTACILAAGSVDEIDVCEVPARRYDSVLSASAGNYKAVCKHLMDVVNRELGAAGIQASSDDLDQCVAGLAKEREKYGAERFRKQTDCILAADAMEAILRCDPGSGGALREDGEAARAEAEARAKALEAESAALAKAEKELADALAEAAESAEMAAEKAAIKAEQAALEAEQAAIKKKISAKQDN